MDVFNNQRSSVYQRLDKKRLAKSEHRHSKDKHAEKGDTQEARASPHTAWEPHCIYAVSPRRRRRGSWSRSTAGERAA